MLNSEFGTCPSALAPDSEHSDRTPAASKFTRRELLWCILLFVLATAVWAKGITVGGFRWGDAGIHAMDGVLIHDWIQEGPSAWTDPVGFAQRQYSYYPCLGIGSNYPPGLAVIEAGFFAVFGISVVTARACVVALALWGAVGLYILVRRFGGTLAATCSVLALLSMPSVVDWSRQNMLEAPTMAVLIWSLIAACRYLERPSWSRLALWVSLSVAAVMFKQTAAFVVLPNAALIVWSCATHRAPWRHVVAAALGTLLPVGTYFLLISSPGDGPLVFEYLLLGQSPDAMLSSRSWHSYLSWLPAQTGWVALILAAAGLLLVCIRRDLLGVIMMLWLVTFYVMISLIQHQQPRYFYLGLLPLAVWAGSSAGRLIDCIGWLPLRRVVVAIVAVAAVSTAYARPIQVRPDYGPIVQSHRDLIEGKVVFFDGQRDSDLVFAIRRHLGPRRSVVVRGSKILYACAAIPQFRFETFVSSTNQVHEVLRGFAFDSLIVERLPRMDVREQRLLRQALADSPDYERIASHELAAAPGVEPTPISLVDIDVYAPRRSMQRLVKDYRIPISVDNSSVAVSLEDLLAAIPETRPDSAEHTER